jgi:peptidoglycan/LPS O-acetylase OafA/YrhL
VVRGHEVGYRRDIDGLRAIAVLLVVGFHAFPSIILGGFIGVDVFFVISGYLISTVLFKQLQGSTYSLVDFYSRRVRRIFPGLAIILVFCLLFGWYALLPDEYELLGKHVAASAAFFSNFTFWAETGYFDRAANAKPLLHLWSLGIEEQFYLVWPLLLWLLWRRTRRIGVTISILILASFSLNIALMRNHATATYYFPIARFWELGLGCLLACLPFISAGDKVANSAGGGYVMPAGRVLPIVGFALIVSSAFLFNSRTPFPSWATLLPTCGALFLLYPPGSTWFQRRILGHPVLVFIGVISYSLYLWHWVLLSFATILEAETPNLLLRSAAVALSVALAWLTYRFVELPIRSQRRVHITEGLVACLALLGIAGLAIFLASGVTGRFNLDVGAIRQGPKKDSECAARFMDAHPGVVNYCKSTSSSLPSAVFMGDSRAQAAYDGTVAVIGHGYPLQLLARGGCPPLLDIRLDNDKKEASCDATWNALVKYIRSTKPEVVVLMGGGSRYYFRKSAEAQLAFKKGLENLIAALQKTSRVIYIREIPEYSSTPDCFLRRISLPGKECEPDRPRRAVEDEMASYNHALDEIGAKFPQLRVIDSLPTLCSPTLCSQKLASGEVIYSDELHLSPAGGRRFAMNSGLAAAIVAEIQPH